MAILHEVAMTEPRGFRIGGLGEVAIRCSDLGTMATFYEEILGLERLEGNASPGIVFFRISAGFAGHTCVLALFETAQDAEAPKAGTQSTLHHIALSLTCADQEAAMRWYDRNGIIYRVERFDWIGWRGVFTTDPEGNTVELVARMPDREP